MQRRSFLQLAGAGALAGAPAAAASAAGAAPVRLGYDTYSLRAWNWKVPQFFDFAEKHKLDAIQLSSVGDFESTEPPYLAKVKERAERLGLAIDGGTGCICPTSASYNKTKNGDPVKYLSEAIRVAHAVGARTIRVFLGSSADRKGQPIERHIEETVKVLKAARSLALDSNVKVAVENHSGDMQARELKMLIEEAGKEYVSACLDTGNPMWCVEDPLVALEVLAPYVTTTHIRDSAVYEHPRGAAAQWVALGDGVIDFKKFVARFREWCPTASMHLENITGRPATVLPYLEPQFWESYPKASAPEFARFLAIAKNGRPFSGRMIIADVPGKQPEAYTAALKEQQMVDLERGLEYARKVLDIGVKWRGQA